MTTVPDVFVSYAREDQAFVRRLDAALTERGVGTWVDWEDILPSVEWMREIEAAIEGSDSFVFVVSPDSVRSPACRRELDHARGLQKRIVPVVFRSVDDEQAPEAVRERNWIFCRETDDFDDALDKISSALALDIDWVHAHTRLLVRTIDWETHDHDRSFLLRGHDLEDAEEWLAEAALHETPEPTSAQIEFLAASRRGARRTTRARIVALSGALVVTVALAGIAIVQRNEARHQTRIAQGRALVASSSAALPTDPELSLWFAIQAQDTSPSVQADKLLRQAFLESRIRATYRVPGAPGHPQYRVLAVSPDLRHALVKSGVSSGQVSVRDLVTGRRTAALGLMRDLLDRASFNLQGTEVAVGATVWSVRSGTPLFQLSPAPSSASFSPDGTRLFGVVRDGLMTWDDKGTQVGSIATSDLEVAANQDASVLLTWPACNTCNVLPTAWDVATGQKRFVLGDPAALAAGSSNPNAPRALVGTAPTTAAAFSPDGTYIATGDGAGVVRIWLVEAPRTPVAEFHLHTTQISSVEFSRDDTRILSGSQDGTARVVELSTGKTEYDLRGHTTPVVLAEFGTSDTRVATIHADGAVRVWDTRPFRARTSPFEPRYAPNAQIDEQGRRILDGGRDGDAGVWSVSSGHPLLQLRTEVRNSASPSWVLDAAMSANGKRVVAAEPGGQAAGVWDVDTASRVVRLHGRGDIFRAPSLDAHGTRAATAGDDGVRIWDARSGTVFQIVKVRHADAAVLDPDGTRLLVVAGRVASIWDASTGAHVATLHGCCDIFRKPVFSPDGSRLITLDAIGLARVWETESGVRIRTGFAPSSSANNTSLDIATAAFGTDGQEILTLSSDGSLRVWDRESGELLVQAPAPTVNVQISVTAAAFSPDRSHAVVVLGSVRSYACPVCVSTPRVLRRSRDHVSPYVARNATSLSSQ